MWYVYIVKCADGTLYTGITSNLSERMRTHNNRKGAKYTAIRTPVELVWNEKCGDKNFALRRELEIKKLSRTGKINLVTGQ